MFGGSCCLKNCELKNRFNFSVGYAKVKKCMDLSFRREELSKQTYRVISRRLATVCHAIFDPREIPCLFGSM